MKTVLLFSAEWCKTCNGVDVIVKNLCKKYNYNYKYCNADDSTELLNEYEISQLPSIIFLSNDIPYKTIIYHPDLETDFL